MIFVLLLLGNDDDDVMSVETSEIEKLMSEIVDQVCVTAGDFPQPKDIDLKHDQNDGHGDIVGDVISGVHRKHDLEIDPMNIKENL